MLNDLDSGFKHFLKQVVFFLVDNAHFCIFFFDNPIAALLLLLNFIDKRLLPTRQIFQGHNLIAHELVLTVQKRHCLPHLLHGDPATLLAHSLLLQKLLIEYRIK